MKTYLFYMAIFCLGAIACNDNKNQKPTREEVLHKRFSTVSAYVFLHCKDQYVFDSLPKLYIRAVEMGLDSAEHLVMILEGYKSKGGCPERHSLAPHINKDSITKRIGVLVGNFREDKDEFRKISFYQPKHIGKYWPRRKAVYAYCNSEGGVFLVSNWYSDDWIFHNSVTFLVGDETLTTDLVPDYSDNRATDINDGVYEHITYTNELPIFRAISESAGLPVKVRFNGQKFYSDIALNQSDKNSIKAAYELGECLKALK